jgi:hypothetical protein
MHVLAAAAALLAVQSGVVAPGDRVTIRVVGPPPTAPTRVYLANVVGTLTPVGAIARGKRTISVRLPTLSGDVYAPATRPGGRVVLGSGRLSLRATPPSGFGALGAAGCAPASPRNTSVTGFGATEVFGTAAGAQFWALGATDGDLASAGLDGVVGQERKIIFRMTGGVPAVFYAVSPDGRTLLPVWKQGHLGSDWGRPGSEWGAGFVFDTPGCWRIHAGTAPAQGDLWLVVRS